MVRSYDRMIVCLIVGAVISGINRGLWEQVCDRMRVRYCDRMIVCAYDGTRVCV